MDYMLQLRQYIGHRPILMAGAAILVLNEQNRLLMLKRSDVNAGAYPAEPPSLAKWLKMLPGVKRSRKQISKLGRWHCLAYSQGQSFTTNTRMGMRFIMSPSSISHAIGAVR
jgi:hypothetical protein